MNKTAIILSFAIVLGCLSPGDSNAARNKKEKKDTSPKYAQTGAVAGEWTADLPAARALAKRNRSFILINICNSKTCGLCKKAQREIFDKDEFKVWAKLYKVSLVYADRYQTSMEPGKTVMSLYQTKFGINAYPGIMLVSGNDGVTGIGSFIAREGRVYNGIKLSPYGPDKFIAIVHSFIPRSSLNPATDADSIMGIADSVMGGGSQGGASGVSSSSSSVNMGTVISDIINDAGGGAGLSSGNSLR